jgi:hypothetical protein
MTNTPALAADPHLLAARRTGGWLVGAAWVVALGWLGGAGALAWLALGQQGLLALDALRGTALGLAGGMPPLLFLLAGYTARENARAAAANALVLSAASRLLRPAVEAQGEARAIADAARADAARLLQLMQETQRQVTSLRAGLNEEARSLTTVTERAGTATGELTGRLSREREALAGLTQALEAQIKTITESIPHLARLMIDSAKQAHTDINASEAALAQRMQGFESSARALAEQASRLDAVAGDTAIHSGRMQATVAGMEDQITATRRSLDMAVKTTELAIAASHATAEALKAAVHDTLEGARKAADAIRSETELSRREALIAIERLREAGAQAEATARAASAAAASQISDTERHLQRLEDNLSSMLRRAEGFAVSQADLAEQRLTRLPNGPTNGASVLPALREPTPPRPAETPAPVVVLPQPPVASPTPLPQGPTPPGSLAELLSDSTRTPAPAPGPTNPNPGDLNWRDFFASLEEPIDSSTSDAFVDRMERAGVRVRDFFEARDMRKIGAAAKKGDRDRRRAVRDVAGRVVDAAARAFGRDEALQRDAFSYLQREEARAIKALEESERRKDAGDARLATFLIVDAAIV